MLNPETTKTDAARSLRADASDEAIYVTPLTDILENENEYVVLADMPGVDPGSVAIQLDAKELQVEAQREVVDGTRQVYRRVFRVGPGVDPNGITAELKQGVLHLVAKKSVEQRARQITVRAG